MKMMKAAVVLAVLGLAGCGVEGTYTMDKVETKKAMEDEVSKLPADQQGFAKLGLALIDQMDSTLELKSGGAMSMKTTMPSLGGADKAKADEKTGTWKKDGDNVILTADGKDLKCAKSGKKLTCSEEKKGGMTMTFVKS